MIDLRKQMNRILDFDNEYNWVIIRSNSTTKCTCWRRESSTADPLCPNCEGGGWIFNEHIEKCKLFYATTFRPVAHLHDFEMGKTYTQNFTVYLRATEENMSIKEGDYIYDIECRLDGTPLNPVVRRRKWLIVDSYNLQTDNNKTDFIKIHAKPLQV